MRLALVLSIGLAASLSCSAFGSDANWEKYHKEGLEEFKQGRTGAAEKSWLLALNEADKFSDTDIRLQKTLNNLVAVYQSQGKNKESLPLAERLLHCSEKSLAPDDQTLMHQVDSLSSLYLMNKQFDKAAPLAKRYLAYAEKSAPATEVARALVNLATDYHYQGRNLDAEALCRKALNIFDSPAGSKTLSVATTLGVLTSIEDALGKYKEAEAFAKRALAIWEQEQGENSPNTASAMAALALVYGHAGQMREADFFYKQAIEILQSSGPQCEEVTKSVSETYKTLQSRQRPKSN